MRIDYLAIYQRSLLGGLGGLFGWALMNLFVHVSTDTFVKLLFKDVLTGALVGLTLGAFTGAWDGLFRDGSLRRLLLGAGVGAGLGLIGGMIGLAVGEVIFTIAGGGLFTRSIGWGIFGALVGVNEGLYKRMRQKALLGAFGGWLGGLIGGSTYESLANLFQWIGLPRGVAISVGGAVGLVLLGLFIGLMVALVEDLMRAAWLLFMAGRFEGQTRTLDPTKPETIVGRGELSDICILGDPQIQTRHARFVFRDGSFAVESLEGPLFVDAHGAGFQAVTRHLLQSGDLIQIGASRAKFQLGGAT